MSMNKKFKYLFVWVLLLVVVVLSALIVSRISGRDKRSILQGVVECRTYRAAPKVAGRIDSMFVSEGDEVVRGELLYVVATPELDAKLRQVDALYNAAAALDKEVDEGARKQQINAVLQLWNKAKAGLELATKSYERSRQLYDKGVIPRQQYDEALANLEAMKATEQAAHAEYELVVEGASQEQKRAAAAKVSEAQGGVDEVMSYREGARVYAPVDGRVTNVISYPGELVSAGLPVVIILDLSDAWVSLNIREDMMHKVGYGTKVVGYVPALDASYDFEIYYISAEASFATWSATRAHGNFDIRTFEVRLKCLNRDVGLLPGMSVIVDEAAL